MGRRRCRAAAVSALCLSPTPSLAWCLSSALTSAKTGRWLCSTSNSRYTGDRSAIPVVETTSTRWITRSATKRSSSPLACSAETQETNGAAKNNGLNGGSHGPQLEGLKESVPAALIPAGDDVCFEGGCPADVEPPHAADPDDADNPALREIKSSSAGPTVWSEFSALAAETGAINLGQGFPNWDPPDFVVAAAHTALSQGFHQYTRTAGHPRLVQLLAQRYSKHFEREVDPFSQVAITIGASQALYVSFQAILSPGDEVILLEPFFDLYLGQIKMAGGLPRQVPLSIEEGEWRLDADALRSAISPRTRAIVINTPHNPTGKVFTREELEAVAEVVRENPRIIVISDEVYKYMVYSGLNGSAETAERNGSNSPNGGSQPITVEGTSVGEGVDTAGRDAGTGRVQGGAEGGRDILPEGKMERGAKQPLPALRHVHFATLPGMWDRTITISSAGKTFSVTGWQVGWVLGPRRIIQEIHTMLPYMQFCAATPLQEAMCIALVEAERPYQGSLSYYDWLRQQYAGKRRRLEQALAKAGIKSLRGEGGFFLIGDVSGIEVPEKYLQASTPAKPVMTQDWAFCRWLALEHGLVAIPTSAFFSQASGAKGLGNGLVRFCFCKTDETIEAAAEVLVKMASEQPDRRSLIGEEGAEIPPLGVEMKV